MKKKIEVLEKMARDMIVDGMTPNLFWVTLNGAVVMVCRDFWIAYGVWRGFNDHYPEKESTLEDRKYGCIATREPMEDNSLRLVTYDDSFAFLKFFPRFKKKTIDFFNV